MSTKLLIRNLLVAVALGVSLSGCSSFMGGALGGAAGAGAGYELSARNQIKTLDRELEEGVIDEAEYKIRKDQVERGSVMY